MLFSQDSSESIRALGWTFNDHSRALLLVVSAGYHSAVLMPSIMRAPAYTIHHPDRLSLSHHHSVSS